MCSSQARPRWLPWFLIPARVLVVTFVLTLLCFAVCLLLGIAGLLIAAALRGGHPDMTVAYRHIAFPAALIGGVSAFIGAIVLELKHYRRNQLRLRL